MAFLLNFNRLVHSKNMFYNMFLASGKVWNFFLVVKMHNRVYKTNKKWVFLGCDGKLYGFGVVFGVRVDVFLAFGIKLPEILKFNSVFVVYMII